MQFVKEHEELKALGYVPVSFRDPECIIQLPCDIALNWHIEKSRGENKHGSVGCGIWETKYGIELIKRCNRDCDMLKKLLIAKTNVNMNIVMTHANEIDLPKTIEECTDFDNIFISETRKSDDIFINN